MTVANVNVTKVLFRRGNTAQNNNYTGVSGEISIDTQARTLRIHDGVTVGGGALTSISSGNFSNTTVITGNIIPSANVIYSLGNVTNQWRDLWVSSNTIYIGNIPLTISNGNLLINGNSITSGSGTDNVLGANVGAYQIFSNANAAAQTTSINSVNANITAANSSITTFNANLGAYQTYANANAATQTTSIDFINANITAANSAIQTLSANIGTLVAGAPGALDTLLELANSLGNSDSFSSTMVNWLGNITSNVTAANSSITTFNANLGEYQTYANANAATQTTSINSINSNVTAANSAITTLQTQVYANANVATYLPTYTGNITAGNLTITGNLDQPNRGFGNGPGTDLYITAGHTQGCSIPGGNTIISGGLGYNGIAHNGGNITLRTGDYYSNQWNFDYAGNLTLPAGGVISEGGGLTGAIRLTPAGGANDNQALLIYPTAAGDGDHVHLTAGGGSTELYLGNDFHYVKLVDGGNVELRAATANLSSQAAWTFDTTGNIDTIQALGIKVPNGVPTNVAVINSTTGSWEANPNLSLATTGGTGTGLIVNVAEVGGYASTIEIATAGTGYTNGDLITVTSGSSNATFTIVIGGRNSWRFGIDGTLITPSNLVIGPGPGSGSRILQYNDVLDIVGEGANSVVMMGWTANTSAPNSVTTIAMNYPSGGEGNVLIAVGNNATIVNYWLFDYTGALTLPGSLTLPNTAAITYANGVNILSAVAGTYSNTNVAAYLSTITSGNVGAGNLTVINNFSTNVISANSFTYANGVNILNGIGGTYSNTNVEAYIGGNIGAYQTFANANAATQATSINTTNANIGAYQTFANANVAGLRTSINSLVTTANTNTAAYLAAGISTNIITTGNVSATNFIGNGVGLTNVTVSAAGNIVGTSSNVTLVAGNYSYTFDNTGNVTLPANVFVGVTNTFLPNTVASFSANVNYYSQVTLQNKSSGNDATADYIVTANNGSDTVNFLDLGIINSGYDNTTPSNSLGNIVFAADSYIYAQGNASNANQSGGNLAIGTATTDKTIKFFAGGTTSSAIAMTVANTGVTVSSNLTTNRLTTVTGIFWSNGTAWSSSGGSGTDDVLRANVGAYQIYANANLGTATTNINSINANIGAFQIYANANLGTATTNITTLFSNAATQATSINSINANIGAFQLYANANIGTLFNGNTSTNANLGAFQIYANANAAALRTSITSLATTANTNTAAYLAAGISTNVTTTGNVTAGNVIINGQPTTYGVANLTTGVVAVQATATGTVSATVVANTTPSGSTCSSGSNTSPGLTVLTVAIPTAGTWRLDAELRVDLSSGGYMAAAFYDNGTLIPGSEYWVAGGAQNKASGTGSSQYSGFMSYNVTTTGARTVTLGIWSTATTSVIDSGDGRTWLRATRLDSIFALNALDTMTTTGNVSVGGNLTVTGTFSGNGSGLTGVAVKTTGSWTVTTGTNTYSFTVPASGTYQLWVDCNIPNGIIAWNATATITNTNVPVVGAQYAWVYNGGGTPIDFVSIPNQFTGTANTIVRSNTAPSATTNRFDFGINNTSGGNVTVRYGWVTIS